MYRVYRERSIKNMAHYNYFGTRLQDCPYVYGNLELALQSKATCPQDRVIVKGLKAGHHLLVTQRDSKRLLAEGYELA